MRIEGRLCKNIPHHPPFKPEKRGGSHEPTHYPPRKQIHDCANKVKTFFSKPHNVILLLMGIVLTITTVAPIVAIVQDTFKIHPGTIDAHLTGQASGYTTVNYTDLFTSRMAKTNLWTPLLNTVLLAVGTCVVSILYGGLFAFLITRTDLAWRKYLSSILIFPYIMPQWTLAVVWQNLFNSNAVTGVQRSACRPVRRQHADMVVQGPVPEPHGAGPALRAVRLYPDRRHLPQHGRES